VICPTCEGEAETRGEVEGRDGDVIRHVLTTPCMNCLGTGEVPDDLTLEDLLNY